MSLDQQYRQLGSSQKADMLLYASAAPSATVQFVIFQVVIFEDLIELRLGIENTETRDRRGLYLVEEV